MKTKLFLAVVGLGVLIVGAGVFFVKPAELHPNVNATMNRPFTSAPISSAAIARVTISAAAPATTSNVRPTVAMLPASSVPVSSVGANPARPSQANGAALSTPSFTSTSSAPSVGSRTQPGVTPGLNNLAASAVSLTEEITIPSGVALPAALVDTGEQGSQAQADALDQISETYLDNLTGSLQPDGSGGGSAAPDVFERAKSLADQDYRTIFGNQKTDLYQRDAAIEAMASK